MRVGALLPYEAALAGGHRLELAAGDRRLVSLDVQRWLDDVDPVDEQVLDRCVAPTLDVGCGPGRFVSALAMRGQAALGVDIAGVAVELARHRGVPALVRDVYDHVPGAGRWPTVLLMDGNIGIGGDPGRLMARVRALVADDGRAIVEAEPDDAVDEVLQVRFTIDGTPTGPMFPWALVGSDALTDYGWAAGLSVAESWSAGGRRFVSFSCS